MSIFQRTSSSTKAHSLSTSSLPLRHSVIIHTQKVHHFLLSEENKNSNIAFLVSYLYTVHKHFMHTMKNKLPHMLACVTHCCNFPLCIYTFFVFLSQAELKCSQWRYGNFLFCRERKKFIG